MCDPLHDFETVFSRDVIQSPDIGKLELRSEVQIQCLHPDIQIKYSECPKMSLFYVENSFILSHGKMTFSRTSDFTDEMT